MYDELVKRLRCLKYGHCPDCPMWYSEEVEPNLWRVRCAAIEAADAIEDLSKAQEQWIEQERKVLLQSIHRWIPVTERLPENDQDVLVMVHWRDYPENMMCYGRKYKTIWYLWNGELGELIKGFDITHWMPLPEPPKEET